MSYLPVAGRVVRHELSGEFAGSTNPSHRGTAGVVVLTQCSLPRKILCGLRAVKGSSAVGLQSLVRMLFYEALLELLYILMNVHLQKMTQL